MNTLYINGEAYELTKPLQVGLDLSQGSDFSYISTFNQPQVEFTLEATISGTELETLLQDPLRDAERTYTVTYDHTYQEQVRRHKKKRINKKWAKRYGYFTKTERLTFENVKIEMEGV